MGLQNVIADAKIAESDWAVTVSFMGLDTTVNLTTPSQSETKLAFNLGAGFDLMITPTVGVFAEGRYVQVAVSGDPIGYLPIRGGLKVMLGQ